MKNATRRNAVAGNNDSASAKDLNRLYRLTPLAAAVITALSPAGPALAQDEEVLDVIMVTATKRELDLQDVPHSINVLSDADIARMGARDIDATVKALPSLYLTALQPGQNSLVMRGISTGPYQYYTEAQVAVYIDEQPMTFSSQQVGVRSIDMDRI
jgi:outer membrane receptor for ferrienterochelin and colicin